MADDTMTTLASLLKERKELSEELTVLRAESAVMRRILENIVKAGCDCDGGWTCPAHIILRGSAGAELLSAVREAMEALEHYSKPSRNYDSQKSMAFVALTKLHLALSGGA